MRSYVDLNMNEVYALSNLNVALKTRNEIPFLVRACVKLFACGHSFKYRPPVRSPDQVMEVEINANYLC